MATFKKVQVVKLSADFAEATNVKEEPLVAPAAGKILVKNHYAGVNATDINISAGRYFTDGKVPFDVGLEGLGVVEAVGTGVTNVKPGQAVMVFGGRGFAEYIYADAPEVIPVPELKPEFINTMVCGLTATIGLDVAGLIKPGEKVLITAAAGGTGQICVQWAKLKGCHVIGTTSNDEKEAYLKSIGCDVVINYRKNDLSGELTKLYPKGVDVIWETIGGQVLETLVDHLAIKGRIVIVGGITGYKTVGFPNQTGLANLPAKLLMKSQSMTGFFLTNESHHFAEYFKKQIELIMTGKMKIRLDMGQDSPGGKFTGVADVPRAVEYLHTGKNTGKVVVTIR